MAGLNQTETKRANDVADHLESAVKKGDSQGYSAAMAEVNKYRDSHKPEDTKSFNEAVTKRLEKDHVLPTVALFETKQDFDKIDTSGNKRLERGELDNFQHRDDLNGVQKSLIGNIQQNYDQIRNYNQYGESWYGGNSAAISDKDVNTGLEEQRALQNLYAKNSQGDSLASRITNKDGNIEPGKIDALLKLDKQNPGSVISPEDRQTLETLNKNKSLWEKYNPFADDQKKEDLEKLANRSGTSVENLEQQSKPGSRQIDSKPVEADEAAKQQDDRNHSGFRLHNGHSTEHEDKIKDALTVRKGESYAHSAERLLAAAGNTNPSSKELHHLSHQLWVADQKRKANGLHSHQVLSIDDDIRGNSSIKNLFE